MANLEQALSASRAAVDQIIAAAERTGPGWTTPRATFQAMHTRHHTRQIGESQLPPKPRAD